MQTRVGAIRGPAQLGDWWGEAECCRRLILEEPANGMHWSNLANALWIHDDLPRALAAARRASGLIPQHPLVWRCLGNVLADLGQFDQSMTSYASSLRLQASSETSFNVSKVLMGLGRWEEAYAVSEERFAQSGFTTYRTGPFWQGWEGARCLWLWGEQGFGDVVQHLRWLVPLLRRGVAVTLELEPALVRLAAEGLAWVGGALEVRAADIDPSPLPRDTCRGSLLSLPHRLGCAPLTTNTPYLRLPDCGSAGRQLLRKVPRIGIVWASGQFLDRHVLERDYMRKSLIGRPLQSLLNALAMRPLELVSLQFGADRQPPPWIGSFAGQLPTDADFYTAARWMWELDLIISVDTAAAHLAGALGLPVWTLLPWAAEARWQRQSSHTILYGSMRLIRQPQHNDWYGLIQRLLAHLDVWLSDWSPAVSARNNVS